MVASSTLVQLAVIAACFALGLLLKRFACLPASTPSALNRWVLWVALPALAFRTMQRLQPSRTVLWASLGLWLVAALAMGLALWASRKGWLTAKKAGALALTCGLGNTSFVGLPLIAALAGAEAQSHAVLIDQLGSFLALSFLAVPFAAHLASTRLSAAALLGRVLRFPALIALAAGYALRSAPVPGALDAVLGVLALSLSPVALTSVGWQLEVRGLLRYRRWVAWGLSYKLLIAPLLVLGVLALTQPRLDLVGVVAVLEAAMPPMVTATILAIDHDLEPDLASATLGLGIPLGLLSVPAWWLLLRGATVLG